MNKALMKDTKTLWSDTFVTFDCKRFVRSIWLRFFLALWHLWDNFYLFIFNLNLIAIVELWYIKKYDKESPHEMQSKSYCKFYSSVSMIKRYEATVAAIWRYMKKKKLVWIEIPFPGPQKPHSYYKHPTPSNILRRMKAANCPQSGWKLLCSCWIKSKVSRQNILSSILV